MALWPAHSIEVFCHNDGGRPRSDSSLSFPVASNHLKFAAPLSVHEEGKELWSSAVNTHSSRKHSDHTAARALHVHTQADEHHTNLSSPIVVALWGSFVVTKWKSSRQRKPPVIPPVITQHTHTCTGTSSHLPPTLYDMRKSFIVRGQKQQRRNLPPSSERKGFKDLSFLLWGSFTREWQRRTCWSTLRRANPPLDPHKAINHQISVTVKHSKGYFRLWFIFSAHLPSISMFSLFQLIIGY